MERIDIEGVELVTVLLQPGVVLCPLRRRVLPYAAGVQNGLPEPLHRLGHPKLGEQLFCPGVPGHGGDAPLIFVLHFVPIGLDDGISGLGRLGHFGLIDALQAVRVLRDQIEPGGERIGIVLPAGFLIVVHFVQGFLAPVPVVELLEGLVFPLHHHLFRAQLVAGLHHHSDEFRLVQIRGDKDLLALLDVDAHFGDQIGIGPQSRLLHV